MHKNAVIATPAGQVDEAFKTVLRVQLHLQFFFILKAKLHRSLAVHYYRTSNESSDLSVSSISNKQTRTFSAFIMDTY